MRLSLAFLYLSFSSRKVVGGSDFSISCTTNRNPQGLALHPITGELWQSEHGPRGGDEINRVQAGQNYGWPTITYGIEYSGQPVGDAIQQRDGLQQPAYYWDPVISPSGMTFFKGTTIPEWQNNLFIGSLSGMQTGTCEHAVILIIGLCPY